MADTVSTAMLVVLETLDPTERAVFVLGEIFGYSYADIEPHRMGLGTWLVFEVVLRNQADARLDRW